MEQKITFNTKDGMNTFQTNILEGELKTLIIKADDPVDIRIVSEFGYELLDIKQFVGVEYYPLVIKSKDSMGWGSNYGNVPFCLNESLIIVISGGPNREVSFLFRLK